MPQYCCVPGCSNFGGHTFPKDPDLNLKWRVAIKRVNKEKNLWRPKKWDVVCGSHFTEEDYRAISLLAERRILKPNAVPSVFNFKVIPVNTARSKRMIKRTKSSYNETSSTIDDNDETMELDIGAEIDIPEEVEYDVSVVECSESSGTASVQCNILTTASSNFSIEYFQYDSNAVQYYTGFDNFDHFYLFYNILGPAVFDLTYKCSVLTPVNQLFLTLIKLRQAKEDKELSILFKISEATVSRLITTWINFIYFQLKEINIWPSKSTIQDTMPESFKYKFPSTRVILDATETPINKPTNIKDQSSTYSTYKSKNTLKTMIGCTPRGFVSYISDSYGGATSDRQIIERSELCDPGMFCKNDSIMADRGIMVQDLFANKDVLVNTPTMLKGKSQLEAEEVVRDRRVASSRVHVERVIGLAKSYKILKRELPNTKTQLGSRIVYICFMLTNFRRSIVHNCC